jgi:hypothetical protein
LSNQSVRRAISRLAAVVLLTGAVIGGVAGPARADPTPPPVTGHGSARAIVPQVTVVVNGKRYTPQEFADSMSGIKYFTVPAGSQTENVVYGFTDKASYDRETARMDRDAASMRAQQIASSWDTVTYYEDIYYGGDQFALGAHQSISNLTNHWAHCGLFGCSANWNDRISSLVTGAYNTKLWADSDFDDTTGVIYFGTYMNVGDLRAYGWSDVASAVAVGV